MSHVETTYDVHCKTYAALFHTAWHLLDCAERHTEGSLLNLQAATVFFAFAFEAYLNHVGSEELKFWDEIDRISYGRKLRILSKHLSFPLDAHPFETVTTLFKLRNALAHGRTQKRTITKPGGPPPRDEAFRLLPWEQLTAATVRQYHDDVRDAMTSINAARPSPDPLPLNPGPRGYSVRVIQDGTA
jgi:hypothetical protein